MFQNVNPLAPAGENILFEETELIARIPYSRFCKSVKILSEPRYITRVGSLLLQQRFASDVRHLQATVFGKIL